MILFRKDITKGTITKQNIIEIIGSDENVVRSGKMDSIAFNIFFPFIYSQIKYFRFQKSQMKLDYDGIRQKHIGYHQTMQNIKIQ